MAGTGSYQIAILGAIGKGLKSIDELDAHLPISRKEISKAACRLVTKDLIERIERGQFQLTPEGSAFLQQGCTIKSGPTKARGFLGRQSLNTFRQRAWAAMRFQRRFTVPSIVMVAQTTQDSNAESNLHTYLRCLKRSGYVVELPAREQGLSETSNGFKVFRLIKDTGYLAPVWSKGQMIDRNEPAEGRHDLSAA